MIQEKHCDDYIDDPSQPECLRQFLAYKRRPASEQAKDFGNGVFCPPLYAWYKVHGGRLDRVRVVMASRLGDVGITSSLTEDHGYEIRVAVDELSGFSKEP